MDTQIKQFTNRNKNGHRAILLIFISTVLQAWFGYARDATPFWKFVIALLCWLSLLFGIKNIRFLNIQNRAIRCLLNATMMSVIVSLLISVFVGEVYSGEKYIVLLTNMYATLDIVGIFYIAVILNISDIKYLLTVTYWMIIVSIILLLVNYDVSINSYYLTYILFYGSVFLPYINKSKRMFLFFGFALSLFEFFGGGRQVALILVFTILSSFLLVYNNKRLTYLLSLIIIFMPLLLLLFSLINESIFGYLANEYDAQDDMSQDTRTFLWMELFQDFDSQSPFVCFLGKGVLGHYESDFFGTFHRFGIEVPVLQWLLQAGYLFVTLFSCIVFVAIYRLKKYGNNRMCQIASIMISGIYLNMFVSNLIGCNLSTLGFWFLISIAFNEALLSASDDDIKLYLK